MSLTDLKTQLETDLEHKFLSLELERDELTLTLKSEHLIPVAKILKSKFGFEQLMDICGVDYALYGVPEWETDNATAKGFDRGVEKIDLSSDVFDNPNRFAVVYHLLSVAHNQRLRLKCFVDLNKLIVPSVLEIWASADWYEREVFDLFGIAFEGHPDLRRILTDYGFIGHPFRKDFPLSGEVEVRYDAKRKQVVYDPVDIEPRVLVPKVIREDNRYLKNNDKKTIEGEQHV